MQPDPAEPTPSSSPADASATVRGAAFQRLFAQVYAELRAVAQRRMAQERPGHTMHATELVHEVYLRLLAGSDGDGDGEGDGGGRLDYANRAHFFHAVGEAMRRILIEHARRRGRRKRGGDRQRVSLDVADLALPTDAADLLAVDEAFRRLEANDARAAEVVRLRFYAGLSVDQTAEAMGISSRSVAREWAFARAWLLSQLG